MEVADIWHYCRWHCKTFPGLCMRREKSRDILNLGNCGYVWKVLESVWNQGLEFPYQCSRAWCFAVVVLTDLSSANRLTISDQ